MTMPRRALRGFALMASLAAVMFTATVASAQYRCTRGFYACNINADGSLDPDHPGCCLFVPGIQRACSPGFYSCRYNAGGYQDAQHPGCCLHVPGIPHVR